LNIGIVRSECICVRAVAASGFPPEFDGREVAHDFACREVPNIKPVVATSR
jgi:hypothetical protein